MKKWLAVAIPATIAASTAAAFLISRKKGSAPAPKASKQSPAKKKALEVSDGKTGTYSFVSGFSNARTVNVSLSYDAARYEYKVIEEEFLSYTSDSHVGAVFGEDFNMQIEYSDYYSGENFDILGKHLADKFKGFGKVTYGSNSGYSYYDGDNICVCLPASDSSYLLITIIKGKSYDDDFSTLIEHDDVRYILSSLTVK